MQVFFKSDRGEKIVSDLEKIIAMLTERGSFEAAYLHAKETDCRDELTSRGWYENIDDYGHFLLINMDECELMPRPVDYHKVREEI